GGDRHDYQDRERDLNPSLQHGSINSKKRPVEARSTINRDPHGFAVSKPLAENRVCLIISDH
ncbi:MAG: hypothetical protein PX634_04565, partial [Microcystis sp. M53600_WE12]|nr:hypothetical protein [Microcystis sp. M53600_WE12]